MTATPKIELACQRCTATVVCDAVNDDGGDPSALGTYAPKRPPHWTFVELRLAAHAVREYGALCPACAADFIHFMRGHVVDVVDRVTNARGAAYVFPKGKS